ncbi:MAG: transglycosylase SLT domain-containing protein [Neisseria sp.]|nr:transglycosylase SLT domain-containing protein [Neisseria sp.]
MTASFKYMVISLLGLPFFACANGTAAANNVSEQELAAYVMQLNNSPLRATGADLDLWGQIRHRFELKDVSPDLVQRFEDFYAKKPEYFNRIVRRGSPYLYHIASEVEKRNMPGEIALLPFIESAFVTRAKSHVGASGIWQFMPKTGTQYGLKQSQWYDGRNDVHAATNAALDYLQYLHGMFGDWNLALAAYNCGEGCVQRAQARAEKKGLPTTFEYLDLPRETREYVPKLLAVRNLVEDPSAFDLALKKIDNRPYFEAVKVDHPIDMAAIARLAKISEEELLSLNPGYKVPVWVPQSGRKLLLPKSAVATFRANLRQADPDALLTWQPHRVGEERQLTEIAKQYGMDLAVLKKGNNLRGDHVPTGSILLVARVRTIATPAPDSVITTNRAASNYMVKTTYNDTDSVADGWYEEPRIINDTVAPRAKNNTVRYARVTVKKGVTLSQIAQQVGMTVKELKALNNLRSDKLRVGQVLKVKTQSATTKRTTTRKVNSKQKTVTNKRVQKKASDKKAAQKSVKLNRKKKSA